MYLVDSGNGLILSPIELIQPKRCITILINKIIPQSAFTALDFFATKPYPHLGVFKLQLYDNYRFNARNICTNEAQTNRMKISRM